MLKEKEIINEIAKRKNMDPRVVSLIANYPFHFTRKVMKEPEDYRPVRIRYFGLFALKPKYYSGKVPKNYNKVGNKKVETA